MLPSLLLSCPCRSLSRQGISTQAPSMKFSSADPLPSASMSPQRQLSPPCIANEWPEHTSSSAGCRGVSTENGAQDFECTLIPGKLKQIDAGASSVWGTNDAGDIYKWGLNGWIRVPGKLIHVSVGPAGVWGVNSANNIFKRHDGGWVQLSGLLKQIDAGGYKFVSGVDAGDHIYCVNQACTISRASNLPYIQLDGSLKYYTCGPYGCWGVNSANQIYYRHNVSQNNCQGNHWQQVDGALTMVEVSTRGLVFGVNADGNVFKREGITATNLIGTSWTLLDFCGPTKHVSYDSGYLWRLTPTGDIYRCSKVEPNPYISQ